MRFTQGYAACCVCSPTRGSIMTGKYPPRFGVTDFIGGMRSGKLRSAPNADHLAAGGGDARRGACATAGYATFFAGKWHLGGGDYSPNAQGFGPGLISGSGGKGNVQFWYPQARRRRCPSRRTTPRRPTASPTRPCKFIDAHKDKPFFAYLPFLAVHTPIGAGPTWWRSTKRRRPPRPADAWGQERERQVRLVQNHAVYAAMLEQLDTAIGRVLAALERNGLAEKTIVVFTSDNGGLSTSEGHPTSNLPLRAGKGWPYEGGIRVPWIVRAPGVTKAGSTCDTPVISTDFYPTLLELAGLPLKPEQHRDGVSLVPLLQGGKAGRRTAALLALSALRQPGRRAARRRPRGRLEAHRMVRRRRAGTVQPRPGHRREEQSGRREPEQASRSFTRSCAPGARRSAR